MAGWRSPTLICNFPTLMMSRLAGDIYSSKLEQFMNRFLSLCGVIGAVWCLSGCQAERPADQRPADQQGVAGDTQSQAETVASTETAAAPQVTAEREVITNSIGLELIEIPAGTFQMGSSESDSDARGDEKPRHEVRITKAFHMGVYEVTQAQYEQVIGVRESFFAPDSAGADRVEGMDTSRFPAEQVTWVKARNFVEKLSALPAEQQAGRGYRLPTEAEWEYACRAGTQTAFYSGDSLSSAEANFNGNYPFGGAAKGPFLSRTTEVGSFQPNAFGLYDMHGNVWEWCQDRYGLRYYAESVEDDPTGPGEGSRRIIRGGDWYSDGRDCRSAFRYADLPEGTFYAMGIRVVMVPVGDPSLARQSTDRQEAAEVKPMLASGEPTIGQGESWPRWRGPRADGTWQGPSLAEDWPTQPLQAAWRQPLGGGYGGVSASAGRVYVMDRLVEPNEVERVLCFDAGTGRQIWEHRYAVEYGQLSYGNGPRATPTVAGDRVYTLGAMGHLCCLDAESGKLIWTVDLVAQYGAQIPVWGLSASVVLFAELAIVHPGAEPEGCLMAFQQSDGTKAWNALPDGAGYATPLVIESGGRQQLVCWTPSHVRSVAPESGELLWSVPFEVNYGTSIAMPIFQDGIVLVSGYYDGSKAIRLGEQPTDAEIIWEDRRDLRGLMAQPLYRDGLGFLLDKRHGLTCFELASGRKLWDDQNQMTPKGRNPQATMVWLGEGDRAIILNSDGELIVARLNKSGYQEQGRAKIIGETWAHPAYAGRHVYARSDQELVSVPLTPEAR